MGQSGCGKTTLLRIIMGAHLPSGGTARVLGEVTGRLDREGLYRMRRKMGMLFQFGALFTDMSVYDNVAFPLREHAELPDELLRDLVLLKLQAVGLRGAAPLMPTELSGGMARRVPLELGALRQPVRQRQIRGPGAVPLRRARLRCRPRAGGRLTCRSSMLFASGWSASAPA